MTREEYRELAAIGIENPDRFQIKKMRRPRKDRPAWAQTRQDLEEVIFGPAREKLKVAYLYWFAGFTAQEVSDVTGFSVRAVEGILRRLRSPGNT